MYKQTTLKKPTIKRNCDKKCILDEKRNNTKTKQIICSNKLRSAIDNFDKILNEHNNINNNKTKIPKLVKAKTCSIIESKCILKKSNSQPLSDCKTDNKNNVVIKTKSLNNLTKFDDFKPQTKVKELVRRLNSLTDVKQINDCVVLKKTVSVSDINSSTMKKSFSKIPVNTNLRKSFPSTPCNLNNLDCVISGSTKNKLQNTGRFNKSTQNLSNMKLSIPKNGTIKRDFVNKTVQNSKIVVKIKTTEKKSKSPKELKEFFEKSANQNVQIAKNLLSKVEKLSAKIHIDNNNKDGFVAIKAPKEQQRVKTAIEKLEDSDQKNQIVTRNNYKTYTKKHVNDTFGERKNLYEPKFIQTTNNKQIINNNNKLTYRKSKENVKKINNNVETLNFVDYEEVKVEKILNYKDGELKKDLDYNSDDSGNISNEIEGDCDESSDNKQDKNDSKVHSVSTRCSRISLEIFRDLILSYTRIFLQI